MIQLRLIEKYWYSKYRMESAVELEELLETTMKASFFEKVKQPTLLLYYFWMKNTRTMWLRFLR